MQDTRSRRRYNRGRQSIDDMDNDLEFAEIESPRVPKELEEFKYYTKDEKMKLARDCRRRDENGRLIGNKKESYTRYTLKELQNICRLNDIRFSRLKRPIPKAELEVELYNKYLIDDSMIRREAFNKFKKALENDVL